jgi:hypothetical protein
MVSARRMNLFDSNDEKPLSVKVTKIDAETVQLNFGEGISQIAKVSDLTSQLNILFPGLLTKKSMGSLMGWITLVYPAKKRKKMTENLHC